MRRGRGGFTLVEMLVAMSLTLVVFAITLPFVRAQTRALGAGAGRLDAEQVARYAQRAIDRELRLATADAGQPLLVYAGPMSIAFNANLLASDSTDVGAQEVAPAVDTALTEAWRVAQQGPLPLSAAVYPTENYTGPGGALSHNETISWFLHPDTVPGRSDVYVLYRRVNNRDSVQVVRGIHVPAGEPFFRYLRPSGGQLVPVPAANLPLLWTSALMDSIRAVRVETSGFYRNNQSGEDVVRPVPMVVALRNRSRLVSASCTAPADVPATGTGATWSANTQPPAVVLTWRASANDDGANDDARSYVLERQRSGLAQWEAVGTVPARRITSNPHYSFRHERPLGAASYQYRVRVLGCGGLLSAGRLLGSPVALP